MIVKNQEIGLVCTGLGAEFEGVCRHEGQVVFVPGALPGEEIVARIIKVTSSYAVGRLVSRGGESSDRAAPPCPYYPRCGGCTAQHLSYAATLAHKRQQVVDCLERIGGVSAPDVWETIGMEEPWRYRNKGAFPVGGAVGAPRIGCFAARSHDIVDAPGGCLLQSEQSDALVGAVRRWMVEERIAPYDEAAHKGLVRHVMTREAKDGSSMLVVVINGNTLPKGGGLIERAREAAPGLRLVVVCENNKRTNVILGERLRTLWGEDALTDEIAGYAMRVSPRTFFQVNRTQAERLYAVALDYAGLTGAERVWDVYCGCGSITLPLAARAAHVTGVEIVEDAVADARENAARNGVENVSFVAGAAEMVLSNLLEKSGAPDIIVLDPPRKGCEPAALAAVGRAGAKRIVYVSCSPATLARDVKGLAEYGYRLERAQPVDMFGWTGHVECVALMTRG